jgi:predicted DNA-binding WGR domain protein
MSRFYRLDEQPDLFGGWCCMREWDRIGRAGRIRMTQCPTPAAPFQALERQRHAKERQGYAKRLYSDADAVTQLAPAAFAVSHDEF